MPRPTSDDLLDRVRRDADADGLNLLGVVDADEFDAAQPCGERAADLGPIGCSSILVLASGGRACWEFVAQGAQQALRARPNFHPIDRHGEAVGRRVLADLAADGIRGRLVLPAARRTLNFVQLGEMGGIGTVSPVIHQLIHPTYGPWVSLRVALLVEGRPFGEPAPAVEPATFQPCEGCAQPCVVACPVDVYCGSGGVALDRCASHRFDGGCTTGCDVRRGCRIGQDHRYGADEEAFRHAYALFMMRQARRGLRSWFAQVLARRR